MSQFLRRKQVAYLLGVERHTLAKIERTDPAFPQFFALSPGVEVVDPDELQAWIDQKRIAARIARLQMPGITNERQSGDEFPRAAQSD